MMMAMKDARWRGTRAAAATDDWPARARRATAIDLKNVMVSGGGRVGVRGRPIEVYSTSSAEGGLGYALIACAYCTSIALLIGPCVASADAEAEAKVVSTRQSKTPSESFASPAGGARGMRSRKIPSTNPDVLVRALGISQSVAGQRPAIKVCLSCLDSAHASGPSPRPLAQAARGRRLDDCFVVRSYSRKRLTPAQKVIFLSATLFNTLSSRKSSIEVGRLCMEAIHGNTHIHLVCSEQF